MLMFSEAAPPGSKLLNSPFTSRGRMQAWVTYTDDGTIRVTILNLDTMAYGPARVRIAGRGAATLQTLWGANFTETDEVRC